MIKSFFSDANDWCVGRKWLLRLLLLIFFAYIFIRLISNPDYQSIFKPINLAIHELGHFIFGVFGEFLGIAGGSILQCLVPIISMFMFYFQRDYFAIASSFGWLSTNLYEVATYIADARALELPLVSPFAGNEIIHDWNYLLEHTGLLLYDTKIAFIVRTFGFFSMLLCLTFGAWLIYNMFRSNLQPQN